MDSGYERRCRLLLRAYPPRYRRARGHELLSTLLDVRAPDQSRPSPRDSWDVVKGGLTTRWRTRPPIALWLAYRLFGLRLPKWRDWVLDDATGRFHPLRESVRWWGPLAVAALFGFAASEGLVLPYLAMPVGNLIGFVLYTRRWRFVRAQALHRHGWAAGPLAEPRARTKSRRARVRVDTAIHASLLAVLVVGMFGRRFGLDESWADLSGCLAMGLACVSLPTDAGELAYPPQHGRFGPMG